ncbi:MAG TPA: mechanosensitive ion channel domain-containing protein [Allosphingosinicella sp.]|jgi:small-conductance mechanosensitive channel|uniref:mechanosensitive ion channel family protein n=1 Tax=Allosphingosinicella sp. TaxID=2823234 RepID=UPI002F285517
MNVSQKTDRMLGESAGWFAANGADLFYALLAGAIVAGLLLGLRTFGHRLVRGRSENLKWRNLVGRVLAKTGITFIILCAIEVVAELTTLPRTIDRAIDILFTIAAVLQGAVWARALILGLLQHRIGEAEQASTFGTAFGLIRGLVSVALFLIALVLILDNLGVNVTGLVAGLGIGGVAIGLAAQGVFKDLFAALAIILDKPFRRGEAIKFDAFSGNVEQIGLKSTRIRSVEGEEIVVSNAILLDKILLNQSAIAQRRILLKLAFVYQTDLGVIARLPDLVRTTAERHEHVGFVRAGLIGIAPSSLDFEAELRFTSPDYDLFFRTRAAIIAELLDTIGEAGLRLAYPTQTSFTAAPDGRHVLPWPQEDSERTLR